MSSFKRLEGELIRVLQYILYDIPIREYVLEALEQLDYIRIINSDYTNEFTIIRCPKLDNSNITTIIRDVANLLPDLAPVELMKSIAWLSDIEHQVCFVRGNIIFTSRPIQNFIINTLFALGYIDCDEDAIKLTDKLDGADFRIMLAEVENYLTQNKDD
jgi:hypothetical protein